MLKFGLLGDKSKPILPHIARMRIEVIGSLSLDTRAGEFRMYPVVDGVNLVNDLDFHFKDSLGILFTEANMKIFLEGGTSTSSVVATNGSGWIDIDFTPETVFSLDRLTIQGMTTAGSTAFKIQVWDNEGNLLWSRGSQVVMAMETWAVGVSV